MRWNIFILLFVLVSMHLQSGEIINGTKRTLGVVIKRNKGVSAGCKTVIPYETIPFSVFPAIDQFAIISLGIYKKFDVKKKQWIGWQSKPEYIYTLPNPGTLQD